MTEVISVRFKNKGKVYYFDPNGITAVQGDHVIVETAKGLEYAECVSGNHEVDDTAVRPPLRPVMRIATDDDTRRAEDNRRREKDAFEICRQKIEKHGLDMKLVDVEYNFEGNKILFFFTSDGRVDFRELVKDLASIFKARIELRQIGVRDEARMLGGLGICGKPFCCAQFLDDFQPVSIKMAKTQGLSLNPTKISGTCGRLMCCLKYEQDAYEELVKNVPKVDSFVETPAGKGSVMDVNLLKASVRVRLDDQSDPAVRTFNSDEVTVLGGKAKRAEYLALKAENKLSEPAPRGRKPLDARVQPSSASENPQEPPKRQHRPHQKSEAQRPKPEQQPKVQKPVRTDAKPRPERQKAPTVAPAQQAAESAKQPNDGQAKRPNHRKRYRRGGKNPGNGGTPQGGTAPKSGE